MKNLALVFTAMMMGAGAAVAQTAPVIPNVSQGQGSVEHGYILPPNGSYIPNMNSKPSESAVNNYSNRVLQQSPSIPNSSSFIF